MMTGDVVEANMNRKVIMWVAGFFVVCCAAIALMLVIGPVLKAHMDSGSETAFYRREIETIAQLLDAADRKGDPAAAVALLDRETKLLRALNDRPGVEGVPLNNCRLAAIHLSDGMGALYRGGRWTSRDRYQAALADCR